MLSAIVQEIVEQVENLPEELQRRVLKYTVNLRSKPIGIPGSEAAKYAGLLSPEDAREMLAAVESDCEQIDADGW